jgi:lipopolysaccharide transport system permease protein
LPVDDGCELIIAPHASRKNYWRDLWAYRELFLFLAWRDILVRYKQTVAGVSWAVLQPLLTTLVFSFVFGRIANLPAEGTPYPILVMAGLLPWQLFSASLTSSGESLLANAGLISKIYFPRMIVPLSTVAVAFVSFLISCALLGVMMAWYGIVPSWRIVGIVPCTAMALAAAAGAGLITSALTVRYRDLRFIVPFVVQLGFFVSPVGYSANVVPEPYRGLYWMNPMVGVIEGFRWSLLGGHVHVPWGGVIVSVALIVALCWAGLALFRSVERSAADHI